ncbi:MAG: peptidylprolyl isomerase [Planctomycetota bacterium]
MRSRVAIVAIVTVGIAAVVLAGFVILRGREEDRAVLLSPAEGIPVPSSPAATVNGEAILWDKVLAEILRVYRADAAVILDQQILDRIMAQEAKKQGIVIPDGEVEAGLREQDAAVRAQSGGAKTLETLCAELGQSMDQIRRELRKQLARERLMQKEGRVAGEATDEAVRKWLDEKRAKASIRTSADGLPPHLAAVVNGEEIPKTGVIGELLGRMTRPTIEGILDYLITDRLLRQKLQERGLRVTDAEVESLIQAKREMIRQDPRYYRQTLEQSLKSQGKTIDDLENQLRQNIALARLFEKEIPEEDLRKLFEEGKDALSGKRVRASHIVVMTIDPKTQKSLGPDADAKAKARIAQIRKQLDAGAKFEGLAAKYSDDPPSAKRGGDLGFFRQRGDVVAQVADAAFGMKKGEISPPVKSMYGYHIVKVTDIDPGKGVSFSAERFKLMVQYVGQKSNRSVKEKWIEALRKEAKIEKSLEGIGRDLRPDEQAKGKKAS